MRTESHRTERKPATPVFQLHTAHAPLSFPEIERTEMWLVWWWGLRPCFICGQAGPCPHREPDVDLAELEYLTKSTREAGMRTADEVYGLPKVTGPLFDQPEPASQGSPFEASKQKPTPQEALVAGLIWKHRGRQQPISIERLRELTGYNDRQIKGIVEQLVVTHRMRIGANREEPVGYFVVESAEDQAAAVKPYKSQILAMWRRLRVLEDRQALRELLGQLKLEDQ